MQMSGKKTIPSEIGLLTIARMTMPEPDRMAAARRWLGATGVFGDRERFLLEGFWKLLDECPEGAPVTDYRARHVVYR